jgi:hypothetical protein
MVKPARQRARHLSRALPLAAAVLLPMPAAAQTLEDGLTVARHELRTSVDYMTDRWSEYWEGTLLRRNENIGTLTTQSVAVTETYGVTRTLMVVASLPYVWTSANQGVLHGMHGAQDLTLAAKYRVLRLPLGERLVLGANVVGAVAAPTTDYTPDFLPMSIGLASRRATVRGSAHLRDRRTNLYADGSFGRTWRSNVTLDRPAYYTDGRLTLSDQVAMPDVADWMAGVGYQDARWCIPLGLSGQRTLGGGDIRRQDMPFVSNRMNFTKAHAMVMYTLPTPSSLILGVGAARTLGGRNVGKSTTLSFGVTHVVGL